MTERDAAGPGYYAADMRKRDVPALVAELPGTPGLRELAIFMITGFRSTTTVPPKIDR